MRHGLTLFLSSFFMLAGCDKNDDSIFEASVIVEGTAIKVAAQTGGPLVQLYFDEGDGVEVGQTIAVVDTEKLSYQREQLQASIEELAVQHRIGATNVRRAKEDYQYAETKYTRYLDLFQQNAAAEQVRDDLKINQQRAASALESAQQALQSIASKQKGLQAQAKLLRRQINDAVVTAPVAGTITTLYFHFGETVPPMTPLVEVIDLTKMWAKVYVSETYLPAIKIGQPAQIKIDGTGQTLTGTVAWINAKAEFTPKNILTEESRTALVYAVKIIIDNPNGVLKHGMPVSITLLFNG